MTQPPSEPCTPQLRDGWCPAAVALTSAGQAELVEPRAREGDTPEGPRAAATLPCGLVPSRESQREALKSCERPGFPAPLQSAQTVHCRVCVSFPSAQSGAQLAAAAFYSPPAFVWVRAPTTGRGGVKGRLWCRAAPQTLAPPASTPPGFASVADEGLRSAACCCLRSPPPGAAVAAAPPARAALPKPAGGGCERRSDPCGSTLDSAKGPDPAPYPAAAPFPRFPPLSPPALFSPSAQSWQVTSLLDIRGHPQVLSGGSCQTQAPGTVPSSLLHSPLWH